jgi:hypothetical protein
MQFLAMTAVLSSARTNMAHTQQLIRTDTDSKSCPFSMINSKLLSQKLAVTESMVPSRQNYMAYCLTNVTFFQEELIIFSFKIHLASHLPMLYLQKILKKKTYWNCVTYNNI